MCTCSRGITRRQAIQAAGFAAAAMAAAGLPLGWTRAAETDGKRKKVLFFTRSQGFPHSVVTRKSKDELAFAEKKLIALGEKHGFDVTATKDGSHFTAEKLEQFDLIAFYTTGDLEAKNDKNDFDVPMPKGGKDALLKAIEGGKGFIGFHCASDTFHSKGDHVDPYIRMIGGEFEFHGSQQKAKIRAVSKNFKPIPDLADFEKTEEWYGFKNLNPEMQVLLLQDTSSMSEDRYKKLASYPETWARMHGKGRVFYTSMGHREDVWESEEFHKVVLGGMNWAAGNVDAEIKPNFKEVCPDAMSHAIKE